MKLKASKMYMEENQPPERSYTKEETEAWCKESDLPLNFFELTVQERRDAQLESHRRAYPISD